MIGISRIFNKFIGAALILSLTSCQSTLAQSTAGKTAESLTLEEAVDFALKNYPAVRASLERVNAAQAGVALSRTNCLPRADMLWRSNRATDNNITGLLLPQSIVSPITGPVRTSLTNQTAWGSAAGLLFSWELFDFGYRGAKVDAARAAGSRAKAEASLTRLDVAVATVNPYLTVLAAERTVHAAEEDVQRRETFDKSVHVLVDNQLRAGADASRADAELARARVNLARARQQEKISRAALADILGLPDTSVEVREGTLLAYPPDGSPQTTALASPPVHGHRGRHRHRPLFDSRACPNADRYLSQSQSPGFVRSAAVWRHVPSPDGRLTPRQLLEMLESELHQQFLTG